MVGCWFCHRRLGGAGVVPGVGLDVPAQKRIHAMSDQLTVGEFELGGRPVLSALIWTLRNGSSTIQQQHEVNATVRVNEARGKGPRTKCSTERVLGGRHVGRRANVGRIITCRRSARQDKTWQAQI
eukprot:COSAG06_NODE_10876_length_1603_cov_1.551197_1_plen_126_part_00